MVLKHGSPLRLDGQCVCHAFMSVAFFMFLVYVIFVYAWCRSWLHLCHHVKFDGVVIECVVKSVYRLGIVLCTTMFTFC